jgi:hypothetical protein
MPFDFHKLTKLVAAKVKPCTAHKRKNSATIAASLLLLSLFCLTSALPAYADGPYKLTIKDHVFAPNTLDVPANDRFIIEVENLDPTPAEFESSDLKVEKFVVGGGKIVVRISPLKPGTYKFFDDYHPDTGLGTITAK